MSEDGNLEKVLREKFGLSAGVAARILELARGEYSEKLAWYRRELAELEERYRHVLELSSSAIIIHSGGRLVFANTGAAKMWGAKSPADMVGRGILDFVHPDSKEGVRDRMKKMACGMGVELLEEKFVRLDGKVGNMEVAPAPITYLGQPAIVVVAEDVTLRKEMVELFHAMSDQSPSCIAIIQDRKFRYVNPTFQRASGYHEEELLGKSSLTLVFAADRQKVRRNSAKMLKGERTTPYEYRAVTKSGEVFWVMESMAPIQYMGQPAILANFTDITELKQMEEQLKYMGLHDALTGHYNRAYFEEEMRRLEAARPVPVSIVVCDIDGLKLVNDTMGYSAGDMLLKVAGELIRVCAGKRQVVARMGAGEFNILLARTPAGEADEFCRQLAAEIEKYNAQNQDLPLSMSVGSATGGEQGPGGLNLGDLLKRAADSMFRQKLVHRESARSAIVEALMKTLQARDIVTQEHADRLHDLVVEMAKAVGVSDQNLTDLRLLARFHDIGKVGVPDSILLKPGSLTPEETAVMRRHTEIGHQIALSVPELVPVAGLIMKHHEWWDGTGYPLGLVGEEIPFECRVVAIADAFDAMTSHRPYRRAMTTAEALAELQHCAGSQFEPRLVAELVRIIKATDWDDRHMVNR